MASSPSPLSPVPGQQSAEAHAAAGIPQALWNLRVPLYITRKAAPSTPFIASVPRFSYLAQLLPRLSSFFGAPCSSFHHEEVQMRNLTVGLLVDLYQPNLPWKLHVGDGDEWDIGDTFLNGVKEVSARLAAAPVPGTRGRATHHGQTGHFPARSRSCSGGGGVDNLGTAEADHATWAAFPNRQTSCATATQSRS